MTIERPAKSDSTAVRNILPWAIAAGGLVVYLLTLNHWLSLTSLAQVSRLNGWLWQPYFNGPVTWLAELPLRFLPAPKIPIALNLFCAVCAALTLAVLARSVALLPHDRTHEQRQRQRGQAALLACGMAWLPPVFAAAVCGLQLTFWEYSTVAGAMFAPYSTGAEMLDLLIFAYVIRCLLEYRLDQRERWLVQASFVCALGMTNNWAMIGFFPLYLAAVVWLKGLAFFNLRFLVRMFLWGLAGLSFYLVLPIAQHATQGVPLPFWQALKSELAAQQFVLRGILGSLGAEKQIALLLALTSLIPLLLISIRWASYFGDTSRVGIFAATLIFHLVHGVFLIVLLWTALDPPFSPRNAVPIPALTLTYLAALCIGYFSGYFLIVFDAVSNGIKRQLPAVRLINFAVTGVICLLFLLMPALLVYRNLPQIRLSNGPLLKQFANAMTDSLPASGVLLSDDATLLLLAEAAATQAGKSSAYTFVDTRALTYPDYHRYLKKKYPAVWRSNPPKERKQPFEDAALIALVASLTESNAVWYLHPSFGYYFEMFYTEPQNLAYRLLPYPSGALLAPRLSDEVLASNESFWSKADQELLPRMLEGIQNPASAGKTAWLDNLFQEAHLGWRPNRQALLLGIICSKALDFWAVELQRHGEWKNAATRFARAMDLNPENTVAKLNLECNQGYQAGRRTALENTKPITDLFGARYRSWDQVMGDNGPFFEPTFSYAQGMEHIRGALYRQAGTQMDRVKTLVPDNLDARLWLAQLDVLMRHPERALQEIQEVHSRLGKNMSRTNAIAVFTVETAANLAATNLAGAEALVTKLMAKYPRDQDVIGTAAGNYLNYGYYTNAIEMIDLLLKLSPNDMGLLIQKGFSFMQLEQFEQALGPLNQALALQTNNYTALFDRAVCNLRSGRLEEAQRDYAVLQKVYPTAYQIYFGLGEIAYRQQDTNAAVRNYELYLANNRLTNRAEAKLVADRLRELKPQKR